MSIQSVRISSPPPFSHLRMSAPRDLPGGALKRAAGLAVGRLAPAWFDWPLLLVTGISAAWVLHSGEPDRWVDLVARRLGFDGFLPQILNAVKAGRK